MSDYDTSGSQGGATGQTTGGSIERTLAGQADLDLSDVLREAWEKSAGVRSIVLISGVVMVLIAMFVSGIFGLMFGYADQTFVESLILQCLNSAATYPLVAGIFMVCLAHSVGRSVDLNMAFGFYSLFVPLAIIGIIQSALTAIGMLLLVLPGLYLALALSLAIPLKVERDLPIGDCLMMSLKLVNAKFVNVLLIALMGVVAMALGFITLIGWIWTVPWTAMMFAITYRQLAGVRGEGSVAG
ncbi:MAG: hypothetical protein R3E82_14560 [Pseudomonadales bacterium]